MSAPKSAPTKRERLRAFMSDGQWHPAHELAAVGGTRFAARLHELRRGVEGPAVEYECRAVGSSDTAFEYRLRPDLPPPELKARGRVSASELIRHQAEEIARLTAELARLRTSLRSERQASLFDGASR